MDATTSRNRHGDDGFTLIELIVVISIIAILIAIMIPSLLEARKPAQDRQAQSLLRNSITAARSIETADGLYATQATLATEEPSVDFVAASTPALAGNRSVSVANVVVGSLTYTLMASHSSSGRCFAVLEQPKIGTKYQRVDNVATCQASDFDPTTGWQDGWP